MDAGAEAKIEKSDVEIWCQDSTKFDFWNMILEIGYTHVLVSNLVRRGFRGQKTLKEMSGGSFNIFFTWLERKRMQDYWVLVERHSFLGLVSNGLQGSTSQLANPNSKKKPMFGVSLINRQTQGLARAALKHFLGALFHSCHLLVQDKLRVVLMAKLFLIVPKPKCMKWLVFMCKLQTLYALKFWHNQKQFWRCPLKTRFKHIEWFGQSRFDPDP